MDIVSTEEIVNLLKKDTSCGYQVSIRVGFINFTRCVYMKRRRIFYFDVNEKFIFNKDNGYKIDEFLAEFKEASWLIEMSIS